MINNCAMIRNYVNTDEKFVLNLFNFICLIQLLWIPLDESIFQYLLGELEQNIISTFRRQMYIKS